MPENSTPDTTRTHRGAIPVASVSLVLLLLLAVRSDLLFPDHPMYEGEWQHFAYLDAAANFPQPLDEAPFCWRLLPPALVHYSPLDAHQSYLLLSFFSLWSIAVLLYLITAQLGFTQRLRWTAVLLYLSTVFVVRQNLIEFAAVDSPALMCMTAAILFALQRKKTLFAIAAFLAVLSKEIGFFVLPLWYTLNAKDQTTRQEKLQLMQEVILLALPAVIAYGLLRVLIVPANLESYNASIPSILTYRIDTWTGAISTLNKTLFEHQPPIINAAINIYRLSFGAIGPYLVLMLLDIQAIRAGWRLFWPLIVLTFLQVLIATDNERLIAIAFPAYIVMTLHAFRAAEIKREFPRNWIAGHAAILFSFQLLLSGSHYMQTYYTVVMQTVFCAVIVMLTLLRKRSGQDGRPSPSEQYLRSD